PSVNTTLTVGWALTPWLQLEGAATLPLSDSQGGQYRTALTVIPFQSSSDTLALQSAALFGDARYMNRFYGVNREQSARAGYSRFDAQGGFYAVESSLTWGHQFTPHWGTSLSVGYTWLGDRAAESPIVYRRNQTSGIMAVNYTF
ncbi:MipA/OmpV family protein, partial [Candidatus Symbiopectobacterium sp. NZEC135]